LLEGVFFMVKWMVFFSFICQSTHLWIQGDYQDEQSIYEYGSYLGDAYLMKYDLHSANIEYEITYDSGGDDVFLFLADMGNDHLMLVCKGDDDHYRLLTYHKDGFLVDDQVLDISPQAFFNHHYLLVVKSEDDIYYIQDNGSFVQVNDFYMDENCQYQGQLFLDGQVIDCHTNLSPGLHQVILEDKGDTLTIQVIVLPKLMYHNGIDEFALEDGMVISEPIYLYSQANEIRVNNKAYQDEIIDQVGDYQVDLYVDGLWIDQISFSVQSKVIGVKDGDHMPFFEIKAFGQVFLNGHQIEGHYIINQPGHYQLVYDDVRIHFTVSGYEEGNQRYIYLLIGGLTIFILIVIKLFKK